MTEDERFWISEWRKEYKLRQKLEGEFIAVGILFVVFFWVSIFLIIKEITQ